MIRAHKIRLNPTPEQEAYFRKAAGTARFVYNWALAEWVKQYECGLKPSALGLKKQFTAIKKELFPFVMEVAKDVAENAFVNVGKAFGNFFASMKGQRAGAKVGYPKFKSKKRSKQSFGLNNDKFYTDGHTLYVPRLGLVNLAEPLRLVGKILAGVVSCVAGKWYIAITVEVEQPKPLAFKKESVGIDLGLKTLATLSDGVEFENQKLLRAELKRLRALSRGLSRKKQGSNRWLKQKQKLAQFHEGIKNQRNDIVHKMTTQISRTYRIVGLEDLNISGMLRNRKLALSISDAALGEIGRQLVYKKDCFGGIVQKVGRFYASSKTCNDCGHIHKELKLSERQWVCQGCGVVNERDWNASKNIEQEALRLVYAVG